jgi:hypothetical protein
MARGNVPGRTVLRSQTPDLISVQHALLSCILLAKASLLASCRGRFITKTKDIMRQSDFPTCLRKIREVRLDRVQGNLTYSFDRLLHANSFYSTRAVVAFSLAMFFLTPQATKQTFRDLCSKCA